MERREIDRDKELITRFYFISSLSPSLSIRGLRGLISVEKENKVEFVFEAKEARKLGNWVFDGTFRKSLGKEIQALKSMWGDEKKKCFPDFIFIFGKGRTKFSNFRSL